MATLTDHDRRRLRVTWWIAGGGLVLGIVLAVGVGAVGGGGRAGFAFLLVSTAFGCMLSALVTGVVAVIDEWRDAPVARRRGGAALGLFLGAAVLMLLASGV